MAALGRTEKMAEDTVNVFISYAHPDYQIAQTLFEILTECGGDRVSCFLDQYTTTTGSDWRKLIETYIETADWLIFIYRPGHVYDYCGIEMGMFMHANKDKIDKTIFSIHDVPPHAVPPSLQHRQNVLISYLEDDKDLQLTRDATDPEIAFYSRTPIAKFLTEFVASPRTRPLFKITPGREIE